MKKLGLLVFIFVLTSTFTFGQLARFDFPATNSLVVTSNDANVTVTNMGLSSGTIETNITTGTYFLNEPYIEETAGWNSTTQSTAKCFTFAITANAGYTFSITNISFNAYATAAGPSAFSAEVDGTSITTVDAPNGALISYSQVVSKSGLTTAIVKIQGWLNGSRTSTGAGVFRLDDVLINGVVTPAVISPMITLSTPTLSGFTYVAGSGPSVENSFAISGSNLTDNISITPPANYEISTGTGGSFVATNPIPLTQSGGNVALTTIYVRLAAGLSAGAYNGQTITATSTGATDAFVTCNGSVSAFVGPTIYRSAQSGNWALVTSWEVSNDGGTTWVAATSTPSSTDNEITIRNTHTITVAANVTVDQLTIDAGGQLNINSGQTLFLANGTGEDITINGTLLNSGTFGISGGTWSVNNGGTFIHNSTSGISSPLQNSTLNSGSTFIYRGSSTLNPSISISGRSYGNLVFESTSGNWSPNPNSGSATLNILNDFSIGTSGSGNVNLSTVGFTALIAVTGNVNIGAGSIFSTGVSQLTFGGWNNNGTYNLTLNNPGGLLLAQSVEINGTLTLTNGIISTGVNTIIISAGGSVVRTSGYVNGALRKNSFTGPMNFEVGTANGYTPVNLVATGTGNFTVRTVGILHPNAIGSNILQMYWVLTNGGLTSSDLTFNYLDADVIGDETQYELARYSSGWAFPTGTFGPNYDFTANTVSIGGVSVFSDWTLGNPQALPVELTSFSASTIGSTVKLSWNTATEINNYGFDVERSVAKDNWEKIGFVNGNGNSNSPKDYSFVDDKVSTGKYSYRLKQIDNDGQFEYSKTIEVDMNAVKKYELTQNYPNPFNPATTIQFSLLNSGMVKLTLYNILGQEIRTLVNEVKEAGTHSINLNASDLNSGVYVYKIESGSFTQTKKMTLVK